MAPDGAQAALDAIFARLDDAAKAGDWQAVRAAAVEALEASPDHPEADRMRRLAELRMLHEEAARLASRDDHKRARKVRRYIQRHYSDLNSASRPD